MTGSCRADNTTISMTSVFTADFIKAIMRIASFVGIR